MAAWEWTLFCGTLVFFMQAGFTCHEAGFVQSKNVIAVSIENLLTFMITIIVFTFAGYPIMHGTSVFSLPASAYPQLFIEIMYASVSVTIFAGAMSERTKLSALLIGSAVASGIIYPFFGRWAWGTGGGDIGWLARLGYMDFAGASVVHGTAGAITLAGLLIAGSRREIKKGKSNIPIATLGVFILWFGWLGFNGGSCTGPEEAGRVFMNTTMAAACGMGGALVSNLLYRRKGRYLISIFNGVLAGLVAATALTGYTGLLGSVAVGFTAGVTADCIQELMEYLHIDDVVNAVPVHLAGGVVGILLLPFVCSQDVLVTGNRIEQLGIQFAGILIDFLWTFCLSWIMFKIIDKFSGVRVTEEEERKGLNIVEFNDLYSWENYMEISSYEAEINEQNKTLSRQSRLLAQTEDIERKKLARELHDSLGQSLAALKLVLKMGRDKTSDKALELTENSIAEMRNILNDLSPAGLKDGLSKGLETMTLELSELEGLTCFFRQEGEIPAFDETKTLNLYRLIQEALTNVVKHAEASEASITCRVQRGLFIVEIKDNGKGFSVRRSRHGIGLSSMRERAEMLGGQIKITSEEGRGTTVIVEVPYDSE
ncbi:MAG: ATP-binding protein [Eubacteriales bacterium]|nr:ATP-binding protein [Eubacteriales bacterium]